MLKLASRTEAPSEDRRFAQGRTGEAKPAGRKDGREGLKAALVRPPVPRAQQV